MSLVTAKIVGRMIYCVGDTKITYAANTQSDADHVKASNPILDGCIKQYIFNGLLICFAGDVQSIEEDIQKYRSCLNVDEVVDIAIRRTDGYDVMVAEASPCRIITIKNREVREVIAGFIGDIDAFEAYQRYYHNPKTASLHQGCGTIHIFQIPEPSEGEPHDYLRMYGAMKEVATDKNISSVGGAIVTVATHKGKFQYMQYCDIFTDEVIIPKPGEPRSIGFGTKEGGGYAVEFSACNENSEVALRPAYFFLQGGFGVVFPEKSNSVSRAQFVKAGNPCQWAIASKAVLGEAVISGYLSLDHCGIEAEKLISKGDYYTALECYRFRLDAAKNGTANRAKLDRYYSGYYVCLFNTNSQMKALSEINELIANNPDFKNCKRYRDIMESTQKIGRANIV